MSTTPSAASLALAHLLLVLWTLLPVLPLMHPGGEGLLKLVLEASNVCDRCSEHHGARRDCNRATSSRRVSVNRNTSVFTHLMFSRGQLIPIVSKMVLTRPVLATPMTPKAVLVHEMHENVREVL
ncbi:hypothetical protein BJX64DRAFT_287550 [Aspergillus heterothallicus]